MFLGGFKAVDDRSPYGNFWFEPVGVNSLSGMRVSAVTAMQVTAVFSCVAVLSESFAILPPVLYRQQGRKKVVVTDHWLYKLLAKRPNRWQNAYQWREMLQGHLALRGNAYCQVFANSRGEVTELVPLNPDKVQVKIKTDGDYYYLVTDRLGNQTALLRGDVFHLKGLSPDMYGGYNPIQVARDSIGGALSAQSYGAKFFANDAKPTGGWIEFPGQFKDPEARKVFRESWQTMQSGNNRGKTAVLEGGMKYHELGVTNSDAQFLETRKFSVEEIARLFRVPPHRIGHLDRSTNNNIEHQGLEFVTYTMMPWAERWEAAIEFDLLSEDDDLQIEFDFSRLLRGDATSRAAYYHAGVLDGWLTRNEARIQENLDPLAGLDEPLRPLNMVMVSEADAEDEEPEESDNEALRPDINPNLNKKTDKKR